jgi:hypothetical protein
VNVVDDNCVVDAYPDYTYDNGNSTPLYVGEYYQSGYPNESFRTYLKFDLSVIPSTETITGATLRLRAYNLPDSSPSEVYVYKVADNNWNEETITWNTRPAGGAYGDLIGSGVPQDFQLLDFPLVVADLVKGEMTFLVRGLTLDDWPNYFYSKEMSSTGCSQILVETTANASTIPLPGAVWLLGSGLLGLGGWRRIRKG